MRKIRLSDLLFGSVIENRDIARCLYFCGLGAYILLRAWDSTMFPRSALLRAAGAVLFFLCIGLKILLCDRFEKKEFFAYGAVLLVGLVSFLRGGNIHFAFLCLLIMGSKGISFRDILKEYLLIVFAVYAAALIASLTGGIENLARDLYSEKKFLFWTLGPSYSMGSIHTTDHAARILFMVLAAYYLLKDKIGLWFPVIAVMIALAVYAITRGTLDAACLGILAVFSLVDILLRRAAGDQFKNGWEKVWGALGILAMPLCALVSLSACAVYDPDNALLFQINDRFSGRLFQGKAFFDAFPVRLFGQNIEMNGYGSVAADAFDYGLVYRYMDISYQQVLMINGLLALLIVIGVYMLTARKYKKDVSMLFSICLISLNCMVSHRLTDVSYIPFILAFSSLQGDDPQARGWMKRLFRKKNGRAGKDSKNVPENVLENTPGSSEPSVQKNYVLNMIYNGTAFLFPLLTFKYASGIIHPTGTGRVSFATSIITYFSLFAQLGIPTYGVREIARYRDNKEEMSRTALELLLLSLLAAAVSYGALFISFGCVGKLAAERILLLCISPMILFKVIGMEWLYKGLEQYQLIAVRSVLCQLLAFGMLFLLVREETDVAKYGFVTVIATSAAGLFNFFYAGKLLDVKTAWKGLCVRRHLKPVLLFFAMTCAITVYTCLDASMLGFMTTDAEVGYYDAAVKVKYALSLLITSLGTVILPRTSYYAEKGRMEEFRNITGKALSFCMMLAIPCAVFFVMYAKESIYLISGPEYDNAVAPMIAIMPALVPIAMTNVFGIQILVPTGREKQVFYSTVAGVLIDLVLNLILIPKYGATGAAIGTLAAEVGVLILQAYALREDLMGYLKTTPFLRIAVGTAFAALGCVLLQVLSRGKISDGSFLSLLTGGVVFGVIYLAVLYKTCKKEIRGILGAGKEKQLCSKSKGKNFWGME